jgi:hypothetical protein
MEDNLRLFAFLGDHIMTNYIFDIDLLKHILETQSKNLCGKVCKRFEIGIGNKNSITVEELTNIKNQVKELIYEYGRDLKNMIVYSSKGEKSIFIEFNKSKEKADGR